MTITELLPFLTQGTIILVTLIALVDFIRFRSPARFDVLLMFGDLAFIVLIQLIDQATGQQITWISLASSLLLMAHPYLLLRLVQHLRPVPVAFRGFAWIGLLLSWAAIVVLLSPLPPVISMALVTYFAVVELYSVTVLVRGAFTTTGVSHWRLLLAATGSALIAAVIVLTGLFAVLPPIARLIGPIQQVLGLLALLCYFFGFAPPAWLRRVWQLNELHRYLVVSSSGGTNRKVDDTLQQLCMAAERTAVGYAALVALWDPEENQLKARTAGDMGQDFQTFQLNQPAIIDVWKKQRPMLLKNPGNFTAENGSPAGLRGLQGVMVLPIATTEQAWGLLLVFLLRRPLFAADDLALLSLFSQQTAVILGYWDLLRELEQRVVERTDQLAAAVKDLEAEVSARKQASNALRAAQERLRFLLFATPAMIYSVQATGDHHPTFVSENVSEQLGFSAQEFSNDPEFWLNHIHPDDAPAVREKTAALFEQDHSAMEYRFQKKDGSYIWIHNESRLVRDLAGNPNELVGYCIDITERKKAEKAIQRLNQGLEQRAQELKAANQELEAFAYSVSHDLRAPLRAIDGFSRILVTNYAQELSEGARRYLNLVRENTQQMGQLIDDLLSFSRTGRQPLAKQRIEPEGLVRLALRGLVKDRNGRPLDLVINPLPPCEADPALLKQVFVNLLSNSLKFTSKRENPRIEVGCQVQNEEQVFFVRDNGVGFDMQYSDKLFGVFQRLHSPQEFEGTGVGLAIVQRIIERHGGRIWTEAKVDQGATFYFTLPKTVETIETRVRPDRLVETSN